MGVGERSDLGGVDPQVDSALVQRRDLVGGDEPQPDAGLHHDPVEDVQLGRGDDVVDGADLLAVGGVYEHALLQDLVGDRLPLINHSGARYRR